MYIIYNHIVQKFKIKIERLKQMKNNYTLNQNTKYQQPIPLGP